MTSPNSPYNPLPFPTSVRLLHLLQPDNDVLEVILLPTKLEDAPPFEALSYTWGDPRSPLVNPGPSDDPVDYESAAFPLVCNGETMHIRRNLYDALRMLQTISFTSIGKTRADYIWIDALCIDQSNLDERTAQVKIMSKIYSQAHGVISWIGPKDSCTSDALEVIQNLAPVSTLPQTTAELHELKEVYKSLVSAADILDADAQREKLGIQPLGPANWAAFTALLHRPYFKRAWILQETTLANSVVVVCGEQIFHWTDFAAVIAFLWLSEWYYLLNTQKLRDHVATQVILHDLRFAKMLTAYEDPGSSAMGLVRARIRRNTPVYKFFALIEEHRSCEATDPRDMVYALLGLARTDEPLFEQFPDLLTPNYHVSAVHVYTNFTRSILRSRGNLKFLQDNRETSDERKVTGLPSWVPDFSAKKGLDCLRTRGTTNGGMVWAASGALPWVVDERDAYDPHLDVQGVLLGHAEEVAARDDPTKFQTRMEVFWRTLVADSYKGQHPASSECSDQFIAHIIAFMIKILGDVEKQPQSSSIFGKIRGKFQRKMIAKFGTAPGDKWFSPFARLLEAEPAWSKYGVDAILTRVEQFIPQLSTAAAQRQFEENYEAWSQPFADIRREMNRTVALRRFFRTDGGLLAIGPLDMEVGDIVWVLAGASTPIVLRPLENGNWRWLGEAYVHGMMKGEILKQCEDDEVVNLVLE